MILTGVTGGVKDWCSEHRLGQNLLRVEDDEAVLASRISDRDLVALRTEVAVRSDPLPLTVRLLGELLVLALSLEGERPGGC